MADPIRVVGKIHRLMAFSSRKHILVRLEKTAPVASNWFQLEHSNENFTETYAMLLLAATNDKDVNIDCVVETDGNDRAVITAVSVAL